LYRTGIHRYDKEGNIHNTNSYACNSLGYTHQELCTLSILDIDPCFSRDYWLLHRAELSARWAGTIETRHRRKDGSTFPVEVSINYLEYEGNPFSFSFTQNITERKQAELELLHHKEHLEELVAERTAELKAANQELKSFSYSVSHDLRAPLLAVSGFTHILSNRYKSALDEQRQHYLHNIETAAERMSKLIDDLLAYSRIGQRGLRLQPVPLDKILSVLVEERTEILTKADFILSVAPDLPAVLGDPTLLRQALANLLDNALTYCRPGVAHRVAVDLEEVKDDIVIIIRDNGIGIAAEYQDKIFDVFQRLHSDDDFTGTGISLSIES